MCIYRLVLYIQIWNVYWCGIPANGMVIELRLWRDWNGSMLYFLYIYNLVALGHPPLRTVTVIGNRSKNSNRGHSRPHIYQEHPASGKGPKGITHNIVEFFLWIICVLIHIIIYSAIHIMNWYLKWHHFSVLSNVWPCRRWHQSGHHRNQLRERVQGHQGRRFCCWDSLRNLGKRIQSGREVNTCFNWFFNI